MDSEMIEGSSLSFAVSRDMREQSEDEVMVEERIIRIMSICARTLNDLN